MSKEKTFTGTIIYERRKGDPPISISSSRGLADYINKMFFDILDEIDGEKEHFIGIYLDARNQIKEVRLLAIGCLTGSLVHPREVFKPAIMRSAAAVLLCHAHPSGDPTPSPEDVQLTSRLEEAGRILGIKVLDHVVVATGGYTSLMERRSF